MGDNSASAKACAITKLNDLPSIPGKDQIVRYRSKVVKARFLDGMLVRAVWCELKNDKGEWTGGRLFLSTDIDLSAEEVITKYGRRWSIESMFNQLKEAWGLKQAWQQSRQTLHRWVHITMIGYGLVQLLTCIENEKVNQLCCHSPWRRENPVTAGQLRKGLLFIFRHVKVREWWQAKCKKFQPPDKEIYGDIAHQGRKAA